MQIGVESARAVDNKRLFVVDTDEITRAALQFMLHDGNETHDLPSLEAAYDRAVQWKPDLLLLGAGVLREQGVAILAAIKTQLADIKILLVADAADAALIAESKDAGVDGVLFKPLTVETVRKGVDAILKRRHGAVSIAL